jgi:hypothetical protein
MDVKKEDFETYLGEHLLPLEESVRFKYYVKKWDKIIFETSNIQRACILFAKLREVHPDDHFSMNLRYLY